VTGLTTGDAVLSGPRRHLTPGRPLPHARYPTRPRDPGPLRGVGLPHSPLGSSPTHSTVPARLDGRAVSRLSSWAHRRAHVTFPNFVDRRQHRPDLGQLLPLDFRSLTAWKRRWKQGCASRSCVLPGQSISKQSQAASPQVTGAAGFAQRACAARPPPRPARRERHRCSKSVHPRGVRYATAEGNTTARQATASPAPTTGRHRPDLGHLPPLDFRSCDCFPCDSFRCPPRPRRPGRSGRFTA
jgi:hypothetical protein